jgi:hypothetical protein
MSMEALLSVRLVVKIGGGGALATAGDGRRE